MIEYTRLKFNPDKTNDEILHIRRFSISANSSKLGSDVCLAQDWKSMVCCGM
jgi:hypothetical protein